MTRVWRARLKRSPNNYHTIRFSPSCCHYLEPAACESEMAKEESVLRNRFPTLLDSQFTIQKHACSRESPLAQTARILHRSQRGWVGGYPCRRWVSCKRGPQLFFDHFVGS